MDSWEWFDQASVDMWKCVTVSLLKRSQAWKIETALSQLQVSTRYRDQKLQAARSSRSSLSNVSDSSRTKIRLRVRI